jgi:hypothetical protein
LRLTAIALAFVIFAVGGCGGDDDGDDSGGQTPSAADTTANGSDDSESGGTDEDGAADADQLSHAEYVREADRICVAAREELGSSGSDLQDLLREFQSGEIGKREYYRRSGDLTAEFATSASSAIDEIEALPRPRSRQAALDAYLDATRSQVTLLEKQAEALRDVQLKASAKLNSELVQARAATQKAARQFGFHRCGGG